jgi:predicted transcriptional regulator
MGNFIPAALFEVLTNTGWKEIEVDVFSILMERGQMELKYLKEQVGLPLTSVRRALNVLRMRHMIDKKKWNNGHIYAAKGPDCLRKWVKSQVKKGLGYEISMKKFLENLSVRALSSAVVVAVEEDWDRVKDSYRSLLLVKDGSPVKYLSLVAVEDLQRLSGFFQKEFAKECLDKRLKVMRLSRASKEPSLPVFNDLRFCENRYLHDDSKFFDVNVDVMLSDKCMHVFSKEGNIYKSFFVCDIELISIFNSMFSFLWEMHE